MSLITIDQLLESVDLDFEPRFVTKDESGDITIFLHKPMPEGWCAEWRGRETKYECLGRVKLAEFADKPWQECIYEVPRKITGKIKKLECYELADKEFNPTGKFEPMCYMTLIQTINSLVDAVNKHADIIQQIGEWGTRKGECLWCEKITKVNLEK